MYDDRPPGGWKGKEGPTGAGKKDMSFGSPWVREVGLNEYDWGERGRRKARAGKKEMAFGSRG